MGNGASRVWPWRFGARVLEDAKHTDDDVDITVDLRAAGPEVFVDVRPVPAEKPTNGTAAADGAVPHGVPLTGPSPPPDAVAPDGSIDGVLGRLVSGTGDDHTVGITYRALKRGSDIIVATLLFVVLLPLLVIIAFSVAFTSRGPVLYRQQRVGRHGDTYTMLKFRSMTDGADLREEEMLELAANGEVHPNGAPRFKAKDDPRCTTVGRVIRRSGLDELPQLINIIVGQMSLIGPRPLPIDEAETLTPDDADLRHSARPGVSGLWQILRTDDMAFETRVALDLLYVRKRSIALDWLVLLMTPVAVVRGRGLY